MSIPHSNIHGRRKIKHSAVFYLCCGLMLALFLAAACANAHFHVEGADGVPATYDSLDCNYCTASHLDGIDTLASLPSVTVIISSISSNSSTAYVATNTYHALPPSRAPPH